MDRLQVMRQFVTVAESGSFSAAARRLGVQQPAISKAIATLEDYLGVRLLVRTPRAHSLTDAGQRYYERARIALDEADAAESAARAAATQLTGRLRIAAPSTYVSEALIPHLGDFLAAHPGLSIDLLLEDRRVDLVEEGVDIAIRAGDLADSTLSARRIDRAARAVVAAPAYLARCGVPDTPAALADHALISYAPFEAAGRWHFAHPERPATIRIEPRLRVTSAEGLRAAILGGLGIGMVSTRMFANEWEAGAVAPVLAEWALPSVDVWAIFPEGRRPTVRARRFAEWAAATLDANQVQGAAAL